MARAPGGYSRRRAEAGRARAASGFRRDRQRAFYPHGRAAQTEEILMAEYVRFEAGRPQEVALKFADGKVVDGQYGEQVMYSLTDGRVMYVEPIVAARIRSLGIQPGECFFIEKRKKGRANDWHVYRETEEAPAEVERPARKRTPAPHVLADRLPDIVAARNAGRELEQKLADSITLVNHRKAEAAAAAAAPPVPPPPAKPVQSAAAP